MWFDNGAGISGDVEVAEKEASDKQIEPHVRILCSTFRNCIHNLLQMSWLSYM